MKYKSLLFTFLFALSFASYAEPKNLTEEMLTVTDKSGNEFYLCMDKDEVIEKLGEPDKISFTTDYPNDKYNFAIMEYSAGITFNYRKGFEKISFIDIKSSDYYVSKNKIKINMNKDDVQKIYGDNPAFTNIYKNPYMNNIETLRLVYDTNDQKIISNDMDPEDKKGCSYSIRFYFNNKTKELICFDLLLNTVL